MQRIRPAAIIAAVLAAVLVALGMVFAIRGLPDSTPAQRSMLAWSQVLFAAAALVAIAEMIWERRPWHRRGFRVVAGIAAVLLAITAVGLIGNQVMDGWSWVRSGWAQALGWTAIALLFGWLVLDSTRRDRRLRRRYLAEGADEDIR